MERWLSQRMSDRLGASPGRADGVCANVEFPSPRRLVGDAVAIASGIDADTDPWLPERAVWPLLEVVEEHLGEPWLAALSHHLGGPGRRPTRVRRARRLATLRHLAELFDRYALHRPAMVRAWAAGPTTTARRRPGRRVAGSPSCGGGCASGSASRTSPRASTTRARGCGRSPELLDLPPRLGIFGLTRLPAGHLQVLRAIAAGRDVHLFLLHPSPGLWDRIERAGVPPVVRRDADPTAELPVSRLLSSWGGDAREMQLVLGAARARRAPPPGRAPRRHAAGPHPGRRPRGPRAARPAAARRLDERPLLDADDRSVQVHACHGRARQVEVLRDAILHLLEDDPTLEPRDVIVMCPDIETFASLIQATFGAGEVTADEDEADTLPDDVRPPDLRVRLADRALRQTNPVLGVVARLIELAGERVTASQVLDLVDREPVRRRFDLDDDDLARIESWVAESGIRWGLDAEHRAPFKLDVAARRHLERRAATGCSSASR